MGFVDIGLAAGEVKTMGLATVCGKSKVGEVTKIGDANGKLRLHIWGWFLTWMVCIGLGEEK